MSEKSPEREAPEVIPYARVGQAPGYRPPKLPGSCVRTALICTGVAAAAELVSLVLPGVGLCMTVPLTAVLAPAALIQATMAVVRNSRANLATSDRQAARTVWGTLTLAGIVLIMLLVLAIASMRSARDFGESEVSAVRLRGVGQSMAAYSQQSAAYPSSLDDLVVAGRTSPYELIAVIDAGRPGVGSGPPYYSSFVYRPGIGSWLEDGQVLLAYERMKWTPFNAALFPRRGRWALYGDGHVQLLDEAEFQQALSKDEQRRRELGWPIPARP